MLWRYKPALVAAAALASGSAFAQGNTKTVEVDCPAGGSIAQALDSAKETKRLIIVVRGICTESVSVERDDVVIRGHPTLGGTILGPDPAIDTVRVSARDVTLEALTVSGGRNGVTALGAARLTVLGATVQSTGRNGVTYASGSNGTIENCTIQSNARDGVSVDASSATIINSTISSNARNGVLVSVGGAARIGVDNRNGAAGNFIRQNGATGIVISSGGYALIAMNEVTGNGVDPTMPRQGVSVIEARADLVGGNTISGHVAQGLFTRGSSVQLGGPALGFSTVNTFSGNGALNNVGGIFAFLGSSLTVRDAVISGNSGPGLTFSLRSQGQIFSSTIQSNSSDGIRLVLGSALLPSTPGTTVSGNSGFGVQCTDPESSVVNTFPPFLSLSANAAGDVSLSCTAF